jgi:hypothetical protein
MELLELPNEEFKEHFRNWLIEQSPKNFKTLSGYEIVKSFINFKYDEGIEFNRKDFQFFVSFKREIIDEIKVWLELFQLTFEDYKTYFELFAEDILLENESSFETIFSEFKEYINNEGFLIDKSEVNREKLLYVFNRILNSVNESKSNIRKASKPKIKKEYEINKLEGVDISKCFNCNKDLNFEEQKRNIRFGKYCKDCLAIKKREYKKEYKKLNPEKTSSQKMKYKRERMKRDITFKILHRLRTRILLVLHGKKKVESSLNLLGCSAEHLKKHLEEQFKDDMSWENYGIKGWHIDHIKPCASFDLSIIEEQKECFHYTNLQPLWWHENLSKSDKIL